jgi:cytochrome c553
MKKVFVILVVLVFAVGMAMAQNYSPTTDVLGAHNNHGRGCAGCHAPHSGPAGNGTATIDGSTSWVALWGQDVAPLYGQSFGFGDAGKFTFVAPADLSGDSHLGGTDPRVGGLLLCLSCHDGKLAKGTMMTNQVFETLPAGYGATPVPTLLGNDTTGAGYANDHPVGENAIIGCGGTYEWDCTVTGGVISMTGTHSSQFTTNYGWTASKPAVYNNNPIVVCTTCHNQHVMNVYKGSIGGVSGYYKTYFGVRGNYNPGSTVAGYNATTQFCRQCHGAEANEMNNATTITTVVGND